jgi:TPR repeat protein
VIWSGIFIWEVRRIKFNRRDLWKQQMETIKKNFGRRRSLEMIRRSLIWGGVYYSEKNYEETFKWYNRAAHGDHGDAQTMLGMMYYFGQGVEENFKEAFKWLPKLDNMKF